MDLHVDWLRPIPLKKARDPHLIYTFDTMKVDRVAGVYIFGRKFGHAFEALYVGKAGSLRGRVKGHLNNLSLMKHLLNASIGKRILLVGRLVAKPGQRQEKCIRVIERTLIRHFLAEGHELVNKQGTRLRHHQVRSSGKHPKRYFPRVMFSERS